MSSIFEQGTGPNARKNSYHHMDIQFPDQSDLHRIDFGIGTKTIEFFIGLELLLVRKIRLSLGMFG